MIWMVVLRLCGQVSIGPNGCFDQSCAPIDGPFRWCRANRRRDGMPTTSSKIPTPRPRGEQFTACSGVFGSALSAQRRENYWKSNRSNNVKRKVTDAPAAHVHSWVLSNPRSTDFNSWISKGLVR